MHRNWKEIAKANLQGHLQSTLFDQQEHPEELLH